MVKNKKEKKKKEGGGGGVEGGGVHEEIEQQKLAEVFTFDLLRKKKSLLSVRLCRQTTAHCVPAGPLTCYLNINDAILHCFIINSSTLMLVVALE